MTTERDKPMGQAGSAADVRAWQMSLPKPLRSEDHESQISLMMFIISILTFALIQGNLD